MRTADPDVVIEIRDGDSIIYRRTDGLRWRVTGKCDRRGDCLIGAVINGVTIESKEQLRAMGDRPDSPLDVPVGPKFKGCCPFEIEVLS